MRQLTPNEIERKKMAKQFLHHMNDMMRKGWRIYSVKSPYIQRSVEGLLSKRYCIAESYEPFNNIIFVRDRYESTQRI